MACGSVAAVQGSEINVQGCGAQASAGCAGASSCGSSDQKYYLMLVEILIRQGLSQAEAEEQARREQQSGSPLQDVLANLRQQAGATS